MREITRFSARTDKGLVVANRRKEEKILPIGGGGRKSSTEPYGGSGNFVAT